MTTKQVSTSMTFEVTVHMSATETADETGADVSDLELSGVSVNGSTFPSLIDAAIYMREATQKGDWTDEH